MFPIEPPLPFPHVCISSILSLFLSLSHFLLDLSKVHLCASHTWGQGQREGGRTREGEGERNLYFFSSSGGRGLTSNALRPLFRHRLPESEVSAVHSAPFGWCEWWQSRQPIRLGPLNGEHAHHAVSLVPEREAASGAWMCFGVVVVIIFFFF